MIITLQPKKRRDKYKPYFVHFANFLFDYGRSKRFTVSLIDQTVIGEWKVLKFIDFAKKLKNSGILGPSRDRMH